MAQFYNYTRHIESIYFYFQVRCVVRILKLLSIASSCSNKSAIVYSRTVNLRRISTICTWNLKRRATSLLDLTCMPLSIVEIITQSQSFPHSPASWLEFVFKKFNFLARLSISLRLELTRNFVHDVIKKSRKKKTKKMKMSWVRRRSGNPIFMCQSWKFY